VTETGQRNRCSVEWTIVAEVGEENTGSILCLPSTFYSVFQCLGMSIIFDERWRTREVIKRVVFLGNHVCSYVHNHPHNRAEWLSRQTRYAVEITIHRAQHVPVGDVLNSSSDPTYTPRSIHGIPPRENLMILPSDEFWNTAPTQSEVA